MLIHGAQPGNAGQSAAKNVPGSRRAIEQLDQLEIDIPAPRDGPGHTALHTAMPGQVPGHTHTCSAGFPCALTRAGLREDPRDPHVWRVSKYTIRICRLFCHKANDKCAPDTSCMGENESCS